MNFLNLPVISHFEASILLNNFKEKKNEARISLDLGLTRSLVKILSKEVILPDGQKISWKEINKVLGDKNKGYIVSENHVSGIMIYSPTTNTVRTLYPTFGAPTTLISGVQMHRIKDIDPWEDTLRKINTLGDLEGANLLDTATGLGYTAIESSRRGAQVTTIEIDPTAIDIAKFNPWSKDLFNNKQIKQIIGDSVTKINDFNDREFSHIVHDPPTSKNAGELYSQKFYDELFRVLKNGGKCFHYIGNIQSEYGSRTLKGVKERIMRSGFSRIEENNDAFGVLIIK